MIDKPATVDDWQLKKQTINKRNSEIEINTFENNQHIYSIHMPTVPYSSHTTVSPQHTL
jgi:hypothetical protein